MELRKLYIQGGELRSILIEPTLFGWDVKIEGEGIVKTFSFKMELRAISFYNWFS
jgi:hypothetical protein